MFRPRIHARSVRADKENDSISTPTLTRKTGTGLAVSQPSLKQQSIKSVKSVGKSESGNQLTPLGESYVLIVNSAGSCPI